MRFSSDMGAKGGSGRAKWKRLLVDPELERWFRSTARGSPITAEVALRRLGRACELLRLDPETLIETARGDLRSFTDSVDDLVTALEKEGKAPSYIEGILKALKSWLRYRDLRLVRKITISNLGRTPTIEDEQVPSQEELARIFRVSPPRVRVAEAFMALADLRPEVLGNHLGTDGLCLGDLPELLIEDGRISFEKIPTMVVVRLSLSKVKHKYFTFLGQEGCTYLTEYLESRVREGERLTAESSIIGHEIKRKAVNRFIRTVKIGDLIRKEMREAGVYKRPYVLRDYAETQLVIAESKGKISHPYLQFFAGHKGDIEARYSTNKGRLPPDMVEDMRESCRRCQEYLQTTKTEVTGEEQIKQAFKKQLLLVAGFKQDEIDRMDLSSMTDDDFQTTVKQRLLGAMVNNGARQKVIGITDVERYIVDGWEYVDALPGDKAIVRVPA